ncbi:MAG: potassium-transporting ATPase subunit B, partial [Acidobacteria bacterium]|nr:potassium-transporting ATPase subunit B [Acidobacteriota bacterium]
MRRVQGNSAWSMPIMKRAAVVALLRLDPRDLWRNPVIFLTEVAAILTTIFLAHGLVTGASDGTAQTAAIAFWLWATVLFSTFSEALAEGRGRAQAQSLRSSRQSSSARLLRATFDGVVREDLENTPSEMVEAARLEPGDAVLVLAGESIPADGEVVHGAATVDESAVTGESAPVIREAGG